MTSDHPLALREEVTIPELAELAQTGRYWIRDLVGVEELVTRSTGCDELRRQSALLETVIERLEKIERTQYG
jgi:hypothetical protein